MNGFVPDSKIEYAADSAFVTDFEPFVKAANGLSLCQVCALSGLESTTVQNWIKRGFVPRPVRKRYRERQVARILLISALRNCMRIESIGELLKIINGDTEDESDDIISEPELYRCFFKAVGESKLKPVGEAVETAAAGYSAPDKAGAERLKKALEIMVYAYIAGQLKEESDRLLLILKENKD